MVEVICAVAIFSMVIATVGGVLVMTSKTYRNGSVETAVQQEAQFAANRIGDIIRDSVEVTFIGGENETGSYGRLVMNSGIRKYAVGLAEGESQLRYGEADTTVADEAIPLTDLLAEHIVSFRADTTSFAEAHTVRLDMTVEAEGREYVMSHNITARNEEVTAGEITPIKTAAIIAENRIILEPGQSYEIPLEVKGTTQGIEVSSADESQIQASVVTKEGKEWVKVTVEKTAGISNDEVIITISTKEKNDMTPLASMAMKIQIRRVDELAINASLLTGEDGKAGAKYRFVSTVTKGSSYLAKKALASWDEDYKNPYTVQWEYEDNFMINGTAGVFSDYFEVVEKEEDIDTPYIIIELKKDLVVGASLSVEGISKHAAIDGGNKCGEAYNNEVKATALLVGPGLDGTETVILEPKESYQTTLPVAECDITTMPALDVLESHGTTVSFADGEFHITLGKNETGDSNGKIKVELRAAGDINVENVRTVEIFVRRINSLNLEVKQLTGDEHPVKQPLLSGADYQFYTSMSGTNMDIMEGEDETEFLPNPYAVEFTWEFRINGSVVEATGATGSVIWDIYQYKEKTGSYTKVYDNPATDPGNQYFRMVDAGTNSEQPCINFMLKQDFPANAQLIVTARALHPAGKDASGTVRNQTGEGYVEGNMIATAILEGENTQIIDPDDPYDMELDFSDGILRGQDFDQFPASHETANYYAQGSVGYEGKWFMRTREILGKDADGNIIYGPWTTYRRMLENSSYKKLNALETRSLHADKRYQLEMAFMAIDPNTQTVYWPYDTSLTAEGSGTGFEGYTNNWDEATQSTPKEDYSSTYNIDRAYIGFQKDGIIYKSYGSKENPVVLHPGESFQIDLYGLTINYTHFQQKCYARVQELVNNTWVEVDNKGWSIQDRSSFLLIKDIQSSAVGTYRISFRVIDNEGADWTVWNGDIWNPSYERLENTQFLLCGANGTTGYLYLRIE